MRESMETVIVGGGQAGLALSYYLGQAGRENVILEQAAQPGEAWRNHRWDSFTLVTPNWSFRLPGAEYRDLDPNGYMPRGEIVRRFEQYVDDFHLPLRCGTRVTAVTPDGAGFTVHTSDGEWTASNVVIATGLFQKSKLPEYAKEIPTNILSLHSSQYRSPAALPRGAVLVVGAGQSGCQIAEELNQSGRTVYLATGSAPRAPRSYRGRDLYEWAMRTGYLDRTADKLPSPQARFASNPLITGKDGGHTLNLHQFYRDGMVLLGHLRGFTDGQLQFANDLKENLAKSDQAEKMLTGMIDKYIVQMGIEAPEEQLPALTDGYQAPEIDRLDPLAAGITTIIWSNGYSFDFSLVPLPIFDASGFPITQRGVTAHPGLYFLGLPYLYKQKSGLLLGVAEDAQYLAQHITQR